MFDKIIDAQNTLSKPFLSVSEVIQKGLNPIKVGVEGEWILKIIIDNTSDSSIENIILADNIMKKEIDVISLDSSKGSAELNSIGQIIWTMEALGAMQSATLVVIIKGKFTEAGQKVLDKGVVSATDMDYINFSGVEINVEEFTINKNTKEKKTRHNNAVSLKGVQSSSPTRGIDLFGPY